MIVCILLDNFGLSVVSHVSDRTNHKVITSVVRRRAQMYISESNGNIRLSSSPGLQRWHVRKSHCRQQHAAPGGSCCRISARSTSLHAGARSVCSLGSSSRSSSASASPFAPFLSHLHLTVIYTTTGCAPLHTPRSPTQPSSPTRPRA